MKKDIILTAIICALVLAAASILTGFWDVTQSPGVLKVGFVYSEDESTPYTYNFLQAQYRLQEEFGDKVTVYVRNNVHGINLNLRKHAHQQNIQNQQQNNLSHCDL